MHKSAAYEMMFVDQLDVFINRILSRKEVKSEK